MPDVDFLGRLMAALRAPTGLAARGRRFWRATTTEFELTDAELLVLEECCRTLDTLDGLQRAIAELGPSVQGSMGQVVLNPAITEARGQRALLHRLLAALALPDDDGQVIRAATTQRGQQAAQARWRGHRKGA
jgi:hypothetical protein